MEKETKYIFVRKSGFTKEILEPNVPFEPIRKLAEYNGVSFSTLGAVPREEPKLITFHARKIITTVIYEEI